MADESPTRSPVIAAWVAPDGWYNHQSEFGFAELAWNWLAAQMRVNSEHWSILSEPDVSVEEFTAVAEELRSRCEPEVVHIGGFTLYVKRISS